LAQCGYYAGELGEIAPVVLANHDPIFKNADASEANDAERRCSGLFDSLLP
jgi:hypothetical protein